MTITAPIVVVTDLDGTLLDHDIYQAGPAAAAVETLQRAGALVVCCSAKTSAEQRVHRAELGITDPFVVENGAAVHGDDGEPLRVLGLAYDDVRARLTRAAHHLGIAVRGFADMSVAEVGELTNLAPDAAERALARDYTEPFVVVDAQPDPDDLAEALSAVHLHLQRGARFWTAGGAHDKGMAVSWLRECLTREFGERPLLYGLGDSYNDAAMLRAVDVAMLVQRPDGTYADLGIDGVEYLDGIGPAGWCDGADIILSTRR